jgi:hypothetical protein
MSSAPMVSVVLPAHQAAAHLREAVDSIQAQTLGDLELIIIDDGSTDDTARIARGIRDPRVRYQRTGHRGVAAALNVALDLARGRYVARMDADDISHPQRLERQVAFLEANPHIGVVGTNIRVVDATGAVIGRSDCPTDDLRIRWTAVFHAPFAHPTVMVRRTVLEAHRLRYDETFLAAQDMELWPRVLAVTGASNLPGHLYDYRLHPHQNSRLRQQQRRAAHDQVVARTVRQLAPDLGLTLDELRWMRQLLAGPDGSLDAITWSVARFKGPALAHAYLDLLDHFAARYVGRPGLDELCAAVRSRTARLVLGWPRSEGWHHLS